MNSAAPATVAPPRPGRVHGTDIVTERVLPAERSRVWRAWTDPERLARWWGPRGFTNSFETFEPRPGGDWRFVMHGPDGTDYPNQSVFRELVTDERIVLDHVCAPHFRLTATFEPAGPLATRVHWRMQFETAALAQQVATVALQGNEDNLDRLTALLEAESEARTLRLHRVLRAPPEKLWRAFTDAKALEKWLPPYGFTATMHEQDLREGGRFRMSFRNFTTGDAHAFGGEYLELVPHERLRYTDRFDDPNLPGTLDVRVSLRPVLCGTELTVEQRDIPDPIPLEMCFLGWQESLLQLAQLVEPDVRG